MTTVEFAPLTLSITALTIDGKAVTKAVWDQIPRETGDRLPDGALGRVNVHDRQCGGQHWHVVAAVDGLPVHYVVALPWLIPATPESLGHTVSRLVMEGEAIEPTRVNGFGTYVFEVAGVKVCFPSDSIVAKACRGEELTAGERRALSTPHHSYCAASFAEFSEVVAQHAERAALVDALASLPQLYVAVGGRK